MKDALTVLDEEEYSLEIFDLYRPGGAEELGTEIAAKRGHGARVYALDRDHYLLVVRFGGRIIKERAA